MNGKDLKSKNQRRNSNRLNIIQNPVVTPELTTPENYFVDKYGVYHNGTYHMHKQGQFCKGNHNNGTMIVENFIRPQWLVNQYQDNRDRDLEKIDWNGNPLDWNYYQYYGETSCAQVSDRGNIRYHVLPEVLVPGDECFDFKTTGNPYGCDNFYYEDGSLAYAYQNCYYDCDFHCKADLYFYIPGYEDYGYPYTTNDKCNTCGGGTASYPNFQLVHPELAANPFDWQDGPFTDVNMFCEQFNYDNGMCSQDSELNPSDCVPPRLATPDTWIAEICVFEDRDMNNDAWDWYDTWLYWFPHWDVNVGPAFANLGCTDIYAENWDEDADMDDGSCTYPDGYGQNSQYRGCLLLTEIMYRANENQTKYDFIELTNYCDTTIDISDWWFHCGGGTNPNFGFCAEGGILWRFPSNDQTQNSCGWSHLGSTEGVEGCYPLGSSDHSHDMVETSHIIPPLGRVVLERHGSLGPSDTEYSKYSGSFKFRGTLNNDNYIWLFDDIGALVLFVAWEPGTGGWPSGAFGTGYSMVFDVQSALAEVEYVEDNPDFWNLTGAIPCGSFDNQTDCTAQSACGCEWAMVEDSGVCSPAENWIEQEGGTACNPNCGSCGNYCVCGPDGGYCTSSEPWEEEACNTNECRPIASPSSAPLYPECVALPGTNGGTPGLLGGFETDGNGYSPGGCTDPLANNYDFYAKWDDGGCIYENYGLEDDETNKLVINEIHWNPSQDLQGPDSDWEFVEIYNRSSDTLNLFGVKFTTQALDSETEVTRFQFDNVNITPNQYIVIANNAESYNNEDYEWLELNNNLFEWQEFYEGTSDTVDLSQQGMTLRLRAGFGINDNLLIDEVTYTSSWGGDASGPSIELIDPFSDNKLEESWITSQVVGGTPGLNNTPNIIGCIDELDQLYEPEATVMCDGCCSGHSIYEEGLIITEINHRNPSSGAGDTLGYEFIEIYNGYGSSINLLDFTLYAVGFTGDASMPGVTIDPGQLLVLCQDATLYPDCVQWPEGGSLLNEGELITLRDPNYNVVDEIELTNIILDLGNVEDFTYELIYDDIPDGIDNSQSVNWKISDFVGGSPGEHTVDGILGCTDELDVSYDPDATIHNSEACSNISIYEGSLVITEIKDRYAGSEFIELYNDGSSVINVNGFRIYAVGWTNENPMPNLNISPGEFLVLAEPPAAIELDGLYDHLTLGINLLAWPDGALLDNDGELVRITDPNNNEVDNVDTTQLINYHGQHGIFSYELTTFQYGGNSYPSNWQISGTTGGTPGLSTSTPSLYGCTDPTAVNYNPIATLDDGMCVYIWGDVNMDGYMDVLDIVMLVNHILSNVILPDSLAIAGDVNQDANIDILDVITLVNEILSIEQVTNNYNNFLDDAERYLENISNIGDNKLNITNIITFIEFLIQNIDKGTIRKIDKRAIDSLNDSIYLVKNTFNLDYYNTQILDNIISIGNQITSSEIEGRLPTSDIMITEVLYDVGPDIGNYYDYQFIEIYNTTNSPIDITGYKLRTSSTSSFSTFTRYQMGCPMGCRYCPEWDTTVLQSYQFMVLANQDTTYNGVNNLISESNLFEWQQSGICGATSNFHLNRTSGLRVMLTDGSNNVLSEMTYYPDGSNGWPTRAELLETNSSLELISIDGETTSVNNWQSSYTPLGTPGLQNTQPPIFGCTDPTSCNFNPEATTNDGSCLYDDCFGECGGPAEPGLCGCDDNESCLGCTDPIALNYDEMATIDDSSCEYFDYANKIVINEIHYNPELNTQGQDADYEFIELYNISDEIIPMVGIKFTTTAAGSFEYTRFEFDVMDFNPNTYIVIANNAATYSGVNGLILGTNLFEWQEFYTDGETPVNLSNSTMTLRIRDPLWSESDDNLPNNLIDEVLYSNDWGGNATGSSLELIDPTFDNLLVESWQDSLDVGGSPGIENSLIIYGCMDTLADNYNAEANVEDGSCIYPDYTNMIIITEIHYNPSSNFQGDDYNYEFIEIYNKSSQVIPLDGFKFTMQGSAEDASEYNRLNFPSVDFPPDEYFVIAINSTPPIDNQGVNPYAELELGVNLFEWVGDQAWTLNNYDAMTLRIKGPDDSVVTSVTYSGQVPWPQSVTSTGSSIEIIDIYGPQDDASNWQSSYIVNGTPGQVNSTPADEMIVGCTDETSCEYDATATVNNPEACIYEDGFGNMLDCGEVTTGDPSGIFGCDCGGQCGGDTWLDGCGVCNGDGTSCAFDWGGGIEITPIHTFGLSVNHFRFKPVGDDPEWNTWVSPFPGCNIISYHILVDRKTDDYGIEQTGPLAPFTVNQQICNSAGCDCPQCALDAYFLPNGGYEKLLDEAGIYWVAFNAIDDCGNMGSYQLQFEVLDSLSITQSINSAYLPYQGMNIQLDDNPTLTKEYLESNDLDLRPQLGMFYYDEEQPPFLYWESVVGDSYEDFEFNLSQDKSESFDVRFTPDVDIRTHRGKTNTESVAYKYYDKELQTAEYYDNTAPTELEFYFYAREPFENASDFFVDRPFIDLNELPAHYHMFIGFIDWGDGSDLEYVDEPLELFYNTILTHTYNNPGLYEIKGYMLLATDGTDGEVNTNYLIRTDTSQFTTAQRTYDVNRELSGYVDYKRFTVKIWLGRDDDYDKPYVDIDYGDVLIGGISPYSIYYKTISRQLGYYPNLEGMIDLDFEQYYDKLDTEYALAQMDEEKVGELVSLFATPVYDQSACDVMDEDICLTGWYYDPSITTDSSNLIYSGNEFNNYDMFGDYLGEVDIGQSRLYIDGTKSMWELLGFSGNNAEASVELLEATREQAVLITAPHGQTAVRPTINGTHGYDTYTSSWAKILHTLTGAPVIYAKYKTEDPNYYHTVPQETLTPAYEDIIGEVMPYKKVIQKYLEEHPNIKFVIDIHGASWTRPWALDLGFTGPRNTDPSDAYTQPIENPDAYPVYDLFSDIDLYAPSLKTDFGKTDFLPGVLQIMENNLIGYGEGLGDSDGFGVTLQHTYTGGGTQNTTTAWVTRDAESEFVYNSDKFVDAVQFEWSRDYRRFEPIPTIDELCTDVTGIIIDEAYLTDGGALTEIMDENSCVSTGFCYRIYDGLVNFELSSLGQNECENAGDGSEFEWLVNVFTSTEIDGYATDTRSMKAMIDTINFINNYYQYDSVEYTSSELEPYLNTVHETWVTEELTTGEVVLNDDVVPLDSHPGNPGDDRYWNNIIPEHYWMGNRQGIIEQDEYIFIVPGSQIWASWQQCDDVEWNWENQNLRNLSDGLREMNNREDDISCITQYPYYPVLPKYNWKGQFDESLGLQGNFIPFGSPYRYWSDYDDKAPISNIYHDDTYLLLDLGVDDIMDNTLMDISGNDNRGNLISDYRIEFDDETRKPSATKEINKIKLGSKDDGAY
tara:strand:- start:3970 stop:14016 length:10047 start_codon:yes stop_codon:yes gene_type:complete